MTISPSSLAPAEDLPTFYVPGRFTPDQSIGYLMHRCLKSVLSQADSRLAPYGLTHAQWLPLFRLLKQGGGTVASMAREQDQDCAAMTRVLDRLEGKGLVRRERSSADRRVVNVDLTDEGRAIAERVRGVLSDVLNAHLRGFSVDEWLQLTALLQRVLANGEALRSAEA